MVYFYLTFLYLFINFFLLFYILKVDPCIFKFVG